MRKREIARARSGLAKERRRGKAAPSGSLFEAVGRRNIRKGLEGPGGGCLRGCPDTRGQALSGGWGCWPRDRCRVADPGRGTKESRSRPRERGGQVERGEGRWREARETRGCQEPSALPRPCPRRAAEQPAHPPACCFPQRGRRGARVQGQRARQPRHPPPGVPDAERQPLPAPQVRASALRWPRERGLGALHSRRSLRSGPLPGLRQGQERGAGRLRRGAGAVQERPHGVSARAGPGCALAGRRARGSLSAAGDISGLGPTSLAPGCQAAEGEGISLRKCVGRQSFLPKSGRGRARAEEGDPEPSPHPRDRRFGGEGGRRLSVLERLRPEGRSPQPKQRAPGWVGVCLDELFCV